LDLLNAEVVKGKARLDLINAKKNYEIAQSNLLNLLGISERNHLILEEINLPDTEIELPPLKELLEIAIDERPLLKGSLKSLKEKKSSLIYTLLSFLPDFRFGWYWSYTNSELPWSLSYFKRESSRSSGFYASLSFDFLSYPFRLSSARRALLLEKETYRLSLLNVLEGVEEAYLSLKAAIEAFYHAKKLLKQADEALRLARTQYELGLITTIELFDAESRYLEAELTFLSSQYELYLSKERLKLEVGKEVIE